MLGRSAASATINAHPMTITSRDSAPTRTSVEFARTRACGRLPRSPRLRAASVPPSGVSRRGSVDASLDMAAASATISAGNTEGSPKRALAGRPMSRRSDRLDVYGLGSLVALLGVVGDLRTLLQRAITLAVDSGVMDEQVLVAIIRCDEAETLVVAEPLYGASWHVVFPPRYVRAATRRMLL